MKAARRMRTAATTLAVLAAALLCTTPTAHAAALEEVTDFGSNPVLTGPRSSGVIWCGRPVRTPAPAHP